MSPPAGDEQRDLLDDGDQPVGEDADGSAVEDVEGSEVEDVEDVEGSEIEDVEDVEGRRPGDSDPGDSGEPDPTEPDPTEPDSGPSGETEGQERDAAGRDGAGKERARARELVEEGRVEDAVELYRKLIRRDPEDFKARNNLGVLYDEIGAHEAALEELDAALDLEPESVEVLVNKVSALASVSRFDEAEGVLRRAERLEPGSADIRRARGILSYRKGLYAEAVEELQKVCRQDAEDGVAHFYLGQALNRLGRVEEALDTLEAAVEIQPANHRAYYTMGILYDKLHLPQQAALMYRKARKIRASS